MPPADHPDSNSCPFSPPKGGDFPGALIVFEGIDGSGKTTAARNAACHFAELGWETAFLKEPTDGPEGLRLRERMVSGEPRNAELEFQLFLSDRTRHVKEQIKPVLERGGLVFLDRYYISSMAYQGALGLDMDMIRRENEKIAVRPDVILYFQVPLEMALERISTNRPAGFNSFENREYLSRVARNFGRMRFNQWVNINAAEPQASVQDNVIRTITEILQGKSHRNIGQL